MGGGRNISEGDPKPDNRGYYLWQLLKRSCDFPPGPDNPWGLISWPSSTGYEDVYGTDGAEFSIDRAAGLEEQLEQMRLAAERKKLLNEQLRREHEKRREMNQKREEADSQRRLIQAELNAGCAAQAEANFTALALARASQGERYVV